MAILMHHIKPWIQRSIAKVEERMRKIIEVHQRLNALELRVQVQPAPLVDVSTLQAAVESLRVALDTILEARVPESEAISVEPVEDTILAVLLPIVVVPLYPPQEHAKRRRVLNEDEAREQKREH